MPELNTVILGDCLPIMQDMEDYLISLVFTDPPYGLGSNFVIRPDGKPDYKKASDFMNKWDMPTGDFWEVWFKESFRLLKYGGFCLMFGIDRQLLLFKYYAALAGFQERQSLYWYFCSSFPKATDLSKMIDNNAGAERVVLGTKNHGGDFENAKKDKIGYLQDNANRNNSKCFGYGEELITVPSSELAKKYDGYKYSVSPLKQTNETIMVFQKPYKTGSCLHDTLAYEDGDMECGCGMLNIDSGRVPTTETDDKRLSGKGMWRTDKAAKNVYEGGYEGVDIGSHPLGRYPSQLFVDSETAEVLDSQSGILKSGFMKAGQSYEQGTGQNVYGDMIGKTKRDTYGDSGGCSRILHQCQYETGEYDLYFYCPKVSKKERNAGLEDWPETEIAYSEYRENYDTTKSWVSEYPDGTPRPMNDAKNNHPTLKPISLITRILKLFTTPDTQIILDPFLGAGSTAIACKRLNRDYIGIEINPEYVNIANKRIGAEQIQMRLF